MVRLTARKPTAARSAPDARARALAPALLLALGLLAALGPLAGCGRRDADYYPLDPGAIAIYDVTVETRNTGSARSEGVEKMKAILTTADPRTIANETLVPQVYHDGRASYYRAVKDGILWVGARKPGQGMMFFKDEGYLLKFPLKEGTRWHAPSRLYLLTRMYLGSFGAVTRHLDAPVEMDYAVEATDETVKVPAGEFRHCVRVHGHGESTYDWGEPFGIIPLVVDQVEWYAPGIGLVKRVRTENPDPGSPARGHLTQELESYESPSWFD
jgi:hypothetical protein